MLIAHVWHTYGLWCSYKQAMSRRLLENPM